MFQRLIEWFNSIGNTIAISLNGYIQKIIDIKFSENTLIYKVVGTIRYIAGDYVFNIILAIIYIGVALLIFKVVMLIIDIIHKLLNIILSWT